MNLWIRSQNKRALVKVNEITIYNYGDDEGVCIETKNGDFLGFYKEEKRALEVLDEIQQYILLPNTNNSAFVYQMPKE